MATADLRKAAVVLMTLPQEQAAGLLSKLQPRQAEAVATEIARSQSISVEEQKSVLLEFAEADLPLAPIPSRLDAERPNVGQASGKRKLAIDCAGRPGESQPFGFLRHVDAQDLAVILADEHPQTIALVLSYLPASYAAAIVPALPEDSQVAVLRRIARIGETNPHAVQEVAEALERRVAQLVNRSFDRRGGLAAVAEIVHCADRASERGLLRNVARKDPELAATVGNQLFAFGDIDKLSRRDFETLSKNVDPWQWAMVLAGTDDKLKQNILDKLPQRARESLDREMQCKPAVERAAIEQTRRQIVSIVRRLHDAGLIDLSEDDEFEDFVR